MTEHENYQLRRNRVFGQAFRLEFEPDKIVAEAGNFLITIPDAYVLLDTVKGPMNLPQALGELAAADVPRSAA